MNQQQIPDKQARVFLSAALLAPLAQTAASCSWLTVALIGGVTLLCCWLLGKYAPRPGPILAALQGLWASLVLSELLHWSTYSWPGHEDDYTIALGILALALWATKGGSVRGARIACVLFWPVTLLLGSVLVSGLPDMSLSNLKPSWQLPDAWLIVVLLLPALLTQRGVIIGGGRLAGLLFYGLCLATVTAGVLSVSVSADVSAPVYELSRSLSLWGIAERFESLIAVALTLGYFATLTFLLCLPDGSGEMKSLRWCIAALAAMLYISGIRPDSRLVAVGCIALWFLAPLLASLKKR